MAQAFQVAHFNGQQKWSTSVIALPNRVWFEMKQLHFLSLYEFKKNNMGSTENKNQ